MTDPYEGVEALTFDLFGTVLDLTSSLLPPIGRFLAEAGSEATPRMFWQQWRHRQRIEQYQDNIVMLGHGGYLPVARRALVYTARLHRLNVDEEAIDRLMADWRQLSPFPDAIAGLKRLAGSYRMVALSNGEPEFLDHLIEDRIGWPFDAVISAKSFGAFKPSPAVYRGAAGRLGLEVGQCLMVSSNSFDVMGARTCGFRAAYVNRNQLPYEDSRYQPDLVVDDFIRLADQLGGTVQPADPPR